MFEYQLFLGFILSDSHRQALDALSKPMRSLFIQLSPSPYLHLFTYENDHYLGKFLGERVDAASLELTAVHLMSLLKTLLISPFFENSQLQLFALPSQAQSPIIEPLS